MFRVGSVRVLATTLNAVDVDEDDEEDAAPELFLVLRVAGVILQRPTFSLINLQLENKCGVTLIRNFVQKVVLLQSSATMS